MGGVGVNDMVRPGRGRGHRVLDTSRNRDDRRLKPHEQTYRQDDGTAEQHVFDAGLATRHAPTLPAEVQYESDGECRKRHNPDPPSAPATDSATAARIGRSAAGTSTNTTTTSTLGEALAACSSTVRARSRRARRA